MVLDYCPINKFTQYILIKIQQASKSFDKHLQCKYNNMRYKLKKQT